MKIVSVNVRSFGKLRNFSHSFTDGINVLQQNNGFGKTTLAAFVKAMLYGFKKNSRSAKYDATNASSWATWNSTEQIGGSMVVENNGTLYRIERSFGATSKGDTLSFTEEKTGKPVKTELSVGEYLLGLTEDSFERSAFLPQEAVKLVSNDNFDTRLAGIVQNAADYNKILDRLAEYQRKLSSTRAQHAVIPDLEKQRRVLQSELSARQQAQLRQRQIDDRLQQITQERTQLDAAEEQLNNKLVLLQTQAVPSVNSEQAQKIAALAEKISRLGDLEKDKATCDDLIRQISLTPSVAQVQRKVSVPMLVCGIVAALAGVGLCFVQWIIGLVAVGVGVALTVASFFVRPAAKTLPAGEQDVLITQFFQIASKYVNCYGMGYPEAQQELWKVYSEYVGDKSAYLALCNSANGSQNAAEIQQKTELLRKQLAQISQKKQDLSGEVGSLNEERKRLNTDTLTVVEQLGETDSQLAQARHKLEVSYTVESLLKKAKENLSTSYLPRLCQRCGSLFKQISAEDWDVVVDKEFSLQLRNGSDTRQLDCFSRGTREIVLLCFRIALSELMFDGTIPFLMIDDAFVNFDESNFLRATQLLKMLAQNTQILYFTCHSRLGNLA